MNRLPEFKTLDQVADFWDNHDLTDYLGQIEQVGDAEAMPGKALKPLQIHLPGSLQQRLADLAAGQGLSADDLAQLWLAERLQSEAPASAVMKDSAKNTYSVQSGKRRKSQPTESSCVGEGLIAALRAFEEDHVWIDNHRELLLSQYPEQWIAAHEGKVIASAPNMVSLMDKLPDPAHTCIEFMASEPVEMIL